MSLEGDVAEFPVTFRVFPKPEIGVCDTSGPNEPKSFSFGRFRIRRLALNIVENIVVGVWAGQRRIIGQAWERDLDIRPIGCVIGELMAWDHLRSAVG